MRRRAPVRRDRSGAPRRSTHPTPAPLRVGPVETRVETRKTSSVLAAAPIPSSTQSSTLVSNRRRSAPASWAPSPYLPSSEATWWRRIVGRGAPTIALSLLVGLILAVAVFARFWNLPLAPLHNDEGVNGWFVTNLLRTSTWNYDPANYHGPTLFYAGLVSVMVFGLNEWGLRLVPAFFGVGVLLLVPALRRQIGRSGAVAALLLAAVSPGLIFFSRDVIHEMLLVFFTLAFVICALRWWESGRSRFLTGAAAMAALMFATKETAILSFVVLGLSVVCLAIYERVAPELLGRVLPNSATPLLGRPGPGKVSAWARFGTPNQLRRDIIEAAIIFACILIALFSSFGRNPAGLLDFFRSFTIWFSTSSATQVSGPLTYLGWLSRVELPVSLLGLVACLFVLWEARNRFAIFTAFWGLGILAAYSLISYKTPWLMLNFVLPFTLLGGYMVGRAWSARHRLIKVLALLVFAVALGFSGWQAGNLAFVDYDHDTNAYVYVPTDRSLLALVDYLRSEDAHLGANGQMAIVVTSPDYWPLPWYFRNDPKAGFYGHMVDAAAPIEIVKLDQVPTLSSAFTAKYKSVGQYTLRGGNELVVYIDRSLK